MTTRPGSSTRSRTGDARAGTVRAAGRAARRRHRTAPHPGELVELHLPLVEYLARRFRNRGEWLDDLTQVATSG